MPSRSRLGKGLGALFPALPGEEVKTEETEEKNLSEKDEEGRTRSRNKSLREGTGSGSSARKTPSGAVSKASGREGVDNSDGDLGLVEGQVSRETFSAGKKTAMPRILDLGNLEHPSDLFFGSTVLKDSSGRQGETDTSPKEEISNRKRSKEKTGRRSGDQEGEKGSSKRSPARKDRESPEQEDLKPIRGGYLVELPIKDICPNAQQPRHIFDEDELAELSRSITEVGVLQPIVVRKIKGAGEQESQKERSHKDTGPRKNGADTAVNQQNSNTGSNKIKMPEGKTSESANRDISEEPTYEIVMGERRWRASQLAGLTTIPAIVKTTSDDLMLRDALLENLHRVALNPLEEAAAYQQMIDEFGLTQDGLSKSISKSRPQITNTLRLLKLPPSVQKNVSSGVLSAGHARALLTLPSEDEMVALAKKIIAEGLSVRATEELVALKTEQTKPRKNRVRSDVWKESPVRQNLESRFDTTVNIRGTKKHGKIEIVFSSPEDMDRILSILLEKQGAEGRSESKADDGWV